MQSPVLLSCCLLLSGCALRPDGAGVPRELLPDPTYAKWFNLRGLGQPDDDGKVKGVFRTSGAVGAPVWTLAQWASKHSFADPSVTHQAQLGTHRFEIANPSKRVVVDSRRGELELGLFASACYDRPRQKGESWPHLLASAALTDTRYPSYTCRVESLQRLDVSLSCRLDSFMDKNPRPDPNLHAAQFQLFLYVQNLTKGDDGFGDMLWFGIPIFDNRYPLKEESYQRDGGKAGASGKFIYSLPGKVCLVNSQGFVEGRRLLAGKDARWVDIRVDVAPWLKHAYALARKNGYLATTELKDLYVSGLNIGWEMPGTYDAVMRLRDFSLKATPQPSVPLSPVQPLAAREGSTPAAPLPKP